ncbi:hypothetical protein [Paenibacillus ferrarius]|uniref:hypothetical protein n=1 Tax=Paenibacillus ferrarius TaxID=1469647 RepID=UPI003D2A3042
MKKIHIQMLLVISVIVLTLVISLTVGLLIAYLKAEKDWIGALIGSLGNIVGGIIGGLVAYFVAAYQIFHSEKNDRTKEISRQKNLLIVTKEELYHNKIVLGATIKSQRFEPNVLKEQVSIETWNTVKIEAAQIYPSNEFRKISTVYRKLAVLRTCEESEIELEDISQTVLIIEELIRTINEIIGTLEES